MKTIFEKWFLNHNLGEIPDDYKISKVEDIVIKITENLKVMKIGIMKS